MIKISKCASDKLSTHIIEINQEELEEDLFKHRTKHEFSVFTI